MDGAASHAQFCQLLRSFAPRDAAVAIQMVPSDFCLLLLCLLGLLALRV